jgi:hypothetical protein
MKLSTMSTHVTPLMAICLPANARRFAQLHSPSKMKAELHCPLHSNA